MTTVELAERLEVSERTQRDAQTLGAAGVPIVSVQDRQAATAWSSATDEVRHRRLLVPAIAGVREPHSRSGRWFRQRPEEA